MSFVIERTFARNYKRERPHLLVRNMFLVLAFSLLLSQYSEQRMPLEVHEWFQMSLLLNREPRKVAQVDLAWAAAGILWMWNFRLPIQGGIP